MSLSSMKLFPDNTHKIIAKGVVIPQFERGISIPLVAHITSCMPLLKGNHNRKFLDIIIKIDLLLSCKFQYSILFSFSL